MTREINKFFLTTSVCINSNAFPERVEGKWEQRGNKTECALIELAALFGYEYTKYRNHENVNHLLISKILLTAIFV